MLPLAGSLLQAVFKSEGNPNCTAAKKDTLPPTIMEVEEDIFLLGREIIRGAILGRENIPFLLGSFGRPFSFWGTPLCTSMIVGKRVDECSLVWGGNELHP